MQMLHARYLFKDTNDGIGAQTFNAKTDELLKELGPPERHHHHAKRDAFTIDHSDTHHEARIQTGLLQDLARDLFELKKEMRDMERRMLDIADTTRQQVREEVERGNSAMLSSIKTILTEAVSAASTHPARRSSANDDRVEDLRLKMMENEMAAMHREIQETRNRQIESKLQSHQPFHDYRLPHDPPPHRVYHETKTEPLTHDKQEDIWKPRYSEQHTFSEKLRRSKPPTTPSESPIRAAGDEATEHEVSSVFKELQREQMPARKISVAPSERSSSSSSNSHHVPKEKSPVKNMNPNHPSPNPNSNPGPSPSPVLVKKAAPEAPREVESKEATRRATSDVISFSAEEFSRTVSKSPPKQAAKPVAKRALRNYGDDEFGDSDSAPATGPKGGGKESEDEFDFDIPTAGQPKASQVQVAQQPKPKKALRNFDDDEFGESDSAPASAPKAAGTDDEFAYETPVQVKPSQAKTKPLYNYANPDVSESPSSTAHKDSPPPPRDDEFGFQTAAFAKPKLKPKPKAKSRALRNFSDESESDEPPKAYKDPFLGDDSFDETPVRVGGWGGL